MNTKSSVMYGIFCTRYSSFTMQFAISLVASLNLGHPSKWPNFSEWTNFLVTHINLVFPEEMSIILGQIIMFKWQLIFLLEIVKLHLFFWSCCGIWSARLLFLTEIQASRDGSSSSSSSVHSQSWATGARDLEIFEICKIVYFSSLSCQTGGKIEPGEGRRHNFSWLKSSRQATTHTVSFF